MSKSSMVQVNRVCLKILFINRPQFLVDSNVPESRNCVENLPNPDNSVNFALKITSKNGPNKHQIYYRFIKTLF